jgi:hypothetical protein
MPATFEITREILGNHAHRYCITRHGEAISYGSALRLWQQDEAFRVWLNSTLAESPFAAFRWETPPVTSHTIDRQFEFVLLNAPELICPADAQTYAEYFTLSGADEGVVAFDNLGKDAVLVVPSPLNRQSDYGHLAAFIRAAPATQKSALWRVVGRTAQQQLSDRPLWISTAGGGVAWLHVRLDSYPKYYGHREYRQR